LASISGSEQSRPGFWPRFRWNVVWWKAFVVGAIAYLICVQRFGVRWIERIAFVLALFAICVWIEALPPAHDVKTSIVQFLEDIRQSIRR
jgi:hypothetical protein